MKKASGRYITWTADDGWFLPDGLAECIQELDDNPLEKKCIVTQYNEGGQDGLGPVENNMYCINTHRDVRSSFYPDHFLVFNSVVLPTQYFHDLGGFDCRFEVCPMAFVDFGARAQLDGIDVTLQSAIFECTHSPGEEGDHAPIHHAQLEHDSPLYRTIWSEVSCLERIKIDYDNWQETTPVWGRRFDENAFASDNKEAIWTEQSDFEN